LFFFEDIDVDVGMIIKKKRKEKTTLQKICQSLVTIKLSQNKLFHYQTNQCEVKILSQ